MPSCIPRPILLLEDVEGLALEYSHSSPEALNAAAATACSSLYRQRCNSIVSNKKNFKISIPRKRDQQRAARRAVVAEFEVVGGNPIPFATTPIAITGNRSQLADQGIELDGNRHRRESFAQLDPGAAPAGSVRSRRNRHHPCGHMIARDGNSVDSDIPDTEGRRTVRGARDSPNHPTPGSSRDDEDDDKDDFRSSPRSAENVLLDEQDHLAAEPHRRRHESKTPFAEGCKNSRERMAPEGAESQRSSMMVCSADLRTERGRERGESEPQDHDGWEDCPSASKSARSTSVGLQRDVEEVVNMVCRLHSRLSDAACWTRHLQEDTRASRQKVASLVAQVRQLSRVKVMANTDDVEQGATASCGGKDDSADEVGERSEAAFQSSRQDEVDHNAVYGDCGSAVRGQDFSRRSGETSGRLTHPHDSPPSPRGNDRSRMSSRSCSPAVSARSFRSNSPTSQPGSPMSQGSGCGSMAPMYSPVALMETDCLNNAASTDGVDCELDQHTGGVSLIARTNAAADASADSEADAIARADGDGMEGDAEAIEGPCRDGCGGSVNQKKEIATSCDEGVDATNGRASENDNNGDTETRSDLAASPSQARLAAKDLPGGRNVNAWSLSEIHTAEAKQQRLDTGNASKRRGGARSRSRSPRRRKKTLADSSEGTKEGRNNVPASTTTSRSPRDGNNASSSSLCSRWGRQGEMAGSPSRSDQGSLREYHRRRRRGKGNRHDSGNGVRIIIDSKIDPAPTAGSNATSKGWEDCGGGIRDSDRGPRDAGTRVERGAQQYGGGARVVTAEEQAEPDLMEAGHVLQALWGLSTTLRRLKYEDDDALGTAMRDKALPAVAGEGDGVREAKAAPPAPCESCLLLAEKMENLRERDRVQQRLLEHSDKLLRMATETATKRQDIRPGPAGQCDTSKTSLSAIASSPEDAGRPEVRDAAVMHGEDEGPQGDGQEAGRIGIRNSSENVEGDPCPTLAEAALAEAAATSADEENEALLAAAEEVWRISEMARDVLEGELERKEEALSTVAKSAKESKEHLAHQAEETTQLKAALQSQEVETEKWKREAEKSISKERDARRAMESAKVAAVDVLRRSEREGKTLRAEADSLKETVAALRTRLAGMQARRQAERKLAAKNSREQMPNTVDHHADPALRNQRQLQQRHPQVQNPLAAFRRPYPGNDNDGSAYSRTSSRRYSSAPRGSGETSLTSIRETGRRRRTHSSPPEIENVAAAAAAASSRDRYGSAPRGTYGAADVDTLLHEYDDGGQCDEAFESLSDEALEEAQGFPWSPSRQVVSGRNGECRAGVGSTVTVNDVPSRDRAGARVGTTRKLSVTLPGASLSRRMSMSMSTTRGVASGKGGDGSDHDSNRHPQSTRPPTAERRQDVRGGSWSSSRRNPSAFFTREGVGGTPIRRRVSSAVDTRERGASSEPARVGGQRSRRIGAPIYPERSAQAARRQDIERVLRRASQSHPPPAPQQRDGSNKGSPGSTDSEASNVNKGDDSENIANTETQGQKHEKGTAHATTSGSTFEAGGGNVGGPFDVAGGSATRISADVPPVLTPPRPREGKDERGWGGGGGGGGWRGLLKAALRRKDQETEINNDDGDSQRTSSSENAHECPGDSGRTDDGVGTGNVNEGGAKARGTTTSPTMIGAATTMRAISSAGREERGGVDQDRKREKMAGADNDHVGKGSTGYEQKRGRDGREPGGETSGDGSYDKEFGKQTVDGNIPSWNGEQARPQKAPFASQKADTACTSKHEEQVRQEQKKKSASPTPLCRTPSPEFWESVEEAGLSTAELERAIEDLTEEEAERLLREKNVRGAADIL